VIRQTKGGLFVRPTVPATTALGRGGEQQRAICATDYRGICFFRRGRRMFVAGCGTVRSSFSA
jgi:hypothetical protein